MGFKIIVGFFLINPIRLTLNQRNVKTFFDKTFLHSVYFSHADVQDPGDFFVCRTANLKLPIVAI